MKKSMTRLGVALGGLALSLTAGAGLAAAEPDVSSMVDSPCSFEQAMTAVHKENPMAAQYLDQSPPNVQFLRVFLSSPRDERISLLNQIKDNPGADVALPVFRQMLTSCTKY
jgi:hemophore-related protein